MIDDLSRTLKAILTDTSFFVASQVRFDRPDNQFAAVADANGVLNLFLYDLRENLELRDNTPVAERIGTKVLIRQPDRRIDCSYLVTAWVAQGAGAANTDEFKEQDLLGKALQTLGKFPKIPDTFLQGVLVGQSPVLPLLVPKVDGMQGFSDFWSTMGNPYRASFTVTVTISVPTFDPIEYPAVTSIVQDTVPNTPDPNVPLVSESVITIGGRVVFDQSGVEVALSNAQIELPDLLKVATTNGDGIFSFAQVPFGPNKLRATAIGFESLETQIDVPTVDMKFNLQPLT